MKTKNNINEINELLVKLNNQEVGKLSISDEKIYFQYSKWWLANGFSISPFQLPLKPEVFVFNKNNTLEIWGVFTDSLPDGWGIRLCINECYHHNINYLKLNILQKLSLTTTFGLGGLKYYPLHKLIDSNKKIEIDRIATDVIKNYNDLNLIENLDQLYLLGGSSGGARPKIHYSNNNEHYIIKIPRSIEDIDSGTKEYEANMLAKKCGINVNECKLIPSKLYNSYFAAKRFDIDKNNCFKHVITIAGLLDADFINTIIDYQTIFEIIKLISVNKTNDYYELFKRTVFNYYFENKDDHIKNISFIYDEHLQGYKLSPAYDITKTPDLKFHQMLCNQKEEPTDDDFLAIAKRYHLNINKCKLIIKEISNVIQSNK